MILLKWAIEELQKQRNEFDGKLKIAHKCEETGTLIEEVHAQKDALEKRISALQDGLKVSSDMVDTPVEDLEEEISQVDDKLKLRRNAYKIWNKNNISKNLVETSIEATRKPNSMNLPPPCY